MWPGLGTFLLVRNWEVGWYWHLVWRDPRHFKTSSDHNNTGGLALLLVKTSWASSFLSMYLFSEFSGTTLELKITYERGIINE